MNPQPPSDSKKESAAPADTTPSVNSLPEGAVFSEVASEDHTQAVAVAPSEEQPTTEKPTKHAPKTELGVPPSQPKSVTTTVKGSGLGVAISVATVIFALLIFLAYMAIKSTK